MSDTDSDAGFLSRWSRRKAQARQGVMPLEPAPETDPGVTGSVAVDAPVATNAPAQIPADPAQPPPTDVAAQTYERPPPPTLADVAALTRDSDYSRFVAPDVSGEVKNAALKKLFGNPHFNVMDGLDVYIDDYSKPDPLPASIARQLAQSAFLGFVEAKPSQTSPEPPAAAGQPAVANESPQTLTPAEATGERCEANPETDENADLRLQPHDAAGCGGAENSAAADGPGQL
jgi:Protein of unknown function (DUF3306)